MLSATLYPTPPSERKMTRSKINRLRLRMRFSRNQVLKIPLFPVRVKQRARKLHLPHKYIDNSRQDNVFFLGRSKYFEPEVAAPKLPSPPLYPHYFESRNGPPT